MNLYTFDSAAEKRQFAEVFQRIYVIIRVVSSRDFVRLETFRPYCTESHVKFNKLFDWMHDNETMHAMFGHAADIIEANDCKGLAQLGEGRLECFHKLMKRFRDRLSRKTNLSDNIIDMFSRLYLHSAPMIRAMRPKRNKGNKKGEFEYEDDRIVASFLIQEDQ